MLLEYTASLEGTGRKVEKLVYLIWAPADEDPDALHRQLLGGCASELLERGAAGLEIDIDDSDADVRTPMPWPADELPLRASVSLWLDCYDRRAPFEDVLSTVGERRAGYLVSESMYTEYGGNRHAKARSWPDGERSPGVVMLTLLERPGHLSRADWIAHWHGVQSPESEAIQPRTRYVRNTVLWPVTADAPPYEGIVKEAWPSKQHVEDPMLFYCADGDKEQLGRNIQRMMTSVQGFLELPRIRSATLSEYLLKT